jgi:hypothetical protein
MTASNQITTELLIAVGGTVPHDLTVVLTATVEVRDVAAA